MLLCRQPEAFSELMEFEIGAKGYVTAVICFEPNNLKPKVYIIGDESDYESYMSYEELKRELLVNSSMLKAAYESVDYRTTDSLVEELGDYFYGVYLEIIKKGENYES